MARPNKQGVDYFPLDVHLDDKFKFIEIKYKLEGFAILIKLLQKIYSYGYWYKWTEDEALLFSDELRANLDTVNGVVSECLERNVFDKNLYEKYNILTSTGIQKRYKEIVKRRKDVKVTEEYLLIDNVFGVNDNIKSTSSKHDDSKSTQSKVKESKVKESKEVKHSCRKYIFDDTHYSIANRFYKNILQNNPNHKKPNLEKWSNDIRLMIEQDKRTIEQIEFLVDWVQQDSFEMSNVLSTDKLRKRFDQLAMKVKTMAQRSQKNDQRKPKAFQSLEDWAEEDG